MMYLSRKTFWIPCFWKWKSFRVCRIRALEVIAGLSEIIYNLISACGHHVFVRSTFNEVPKSEHVLVIDQGEQRHCSLLPKPNLDSKFNL